jgi:hypothetical protein
MVATAGIHILLLLAWHLARPAAAPALADPGVAVQWLRPLIKPPAPASRPRAARAARPAAAPAAAPAIVRAPPRPIVAEPPAIVLKDDPFAAATPDARHPDAVRRQALRDLGKIDLDLRKASLNKYARPEDTPEKRLVRAIEAARILPKWYEKAEIEEIADNTGSGTRVYRIRSAAGVFCGYIKPNHSLNGLDGDKTKPTFANCPGNF